MIEKCITLAQPKQKKKQKYRWAWRINMLSKPTRTVAKYEPPPPEHYKTLGPLDPGVEFRTDHLARPDIRRIVDTKRIYSILGPKFVRKLDKTLKESWNSIYNYYRKKLRDRRLKRLKRKAAKKKAKAPTAKELKKIEEEKKAWLDRMAKPAPPHLPPKIVRKRVPLDQLLANIDQLALPMERPVEPVRDICKVKSAALLYEITPAVLKLSQLTETEKQRRRKSEPIIPGAVKKSALTARCTPRMEKMALPSFSAREAKKHEEDKYDPWVISPNALKYKPSARMMELAKPMDRD